MNESHDLELLIKSRTSIIVVETREELRALDLIKRTGQSSGLPVFQWSLTEGLRRIDIAASAQKFNSAPQDVLGHIRGSSQAGLYVLLDFHPWLDEPLHVRLLKDVALSADSIEKTLVLLSHRLKLPPELEPFGACFELRLPDQRALSTLVREQAREWMAANPGVRVRADEETLHELVRNLSGLTLADARRLARRVIFDDGAITRDDLPTVMEAKYRLLNRQGLLAFEYDTADFAAVGGLKNLKSWLARRQSAFLGQVQDVGTPRGVMLLGVQGSGKSLAARAVAGVWGVPLLRLDFGALYNKFHGETERNLRESLQTAELMAPCVLWMDEIEKGISDDSRDGGTSRRLLGTLLTWMSEKRKQVFIVATANDVTRLPPELIRKGRLDEIFFVDLPNREIRRQILGIHLRRREQLREDIDLDGLAAITEGFSGAELEQIVVSSLYSAGEGSVGTETLRNEIHRTRPLAVVMAEKIDALRAWAVDRTVPAG